MENPICILYTIYRRISIGISVESEYTISLENPIPTHSVAHETPRFSFPLRGARVKPCNERVWDEKCDYIEFLGLLS